MNFAYRILKTDTDFFAAALSQAPVSVWHVLEEGEQLIDYGGVVEGFSPIAIKIDGKRFFRETFEFRLVKPVT